MGSNIGSFEAFKRFSAVNTNICANSVGEQPIGGAQIFTQGSNYDFREDVPPAPAAKQQQVSNINNPTSITGKEGLKPRLLDDTFSQKFKVNLKKIQMLPGYIFRGLKGDQDTNFYEYLSLGNIPYFIGGPMLAAVFAFGITRNNPQAKAASLARTKQIATGVALYYLGAWLAKKVIDIPVKLFRGVDLNRPYENVIDGRAVSKDGDSPKKIEYHKAYESVDFPRWDLIAGDNTSEEKKAYKKEFDSLAEKFGIDKNVQNPDVTLKDAVKKLIISATAFKYALAAPFVALGVALAGQEACGNIGNGTWQNIKKLFAFKSSLIEENEIKNIGLNLKQRASIAGNIAGNFINPLKESFKSLWKNSKIGKAIILAAAIAPVLANLRIFQLTSQKHKNFVDINEYLPGYGLKQDNSFKGMS